MADNSKDKNVSGGCPGSAMRQFSPPPSESEKTDQSVPASQLAQWPIQLTLVPPNAPYFQDADLAVTADCVPFAYANFHQEFLKGRPIVVGCPKLDDLQSYVDKLTAIFQANKLKSVEVLLMEVPCCNGLAQATKMAIVNAGVDLPLKVTTIGVRGENFGSTAV